MADLGKSERRCAEATRFAKKVYFRVRTGRAADYRIRSGVESEGVAAASEMCQP
jgi:hypothetical protein